MDVDICSNISTADKNCIQAQIVDETADMGNFSDFKDSTSIETSTAATCTVLMITTD
jgi:hypothetical protein